MIHLPQPIIVTDIIADVVAKVSTEFQKLPGMTGKVVHFYHENPIQWQNRLDEKTKASAYKFPCIVVFHDFPEKWGADVPTARIPLIAICAETLPELVSDARYAKTFVPVLYPLYELFKQFIARNKGFNVSSQHIVHTKHDRLYWGPMKGQANDYLDAITMENTELPLNKFC
jgi:hypothetical protein